MISNARNRISDMNIDPDCAFAKGLGWASIGIGLLELVAPKMVENMLGIDHTKSTRAVLRTFGIREICQGAAILTETELTPQMKAGVWARVAGDAIDTVALAKAGANTKNPGSFAMVAASVAAIGLLDFVCAKRLSDRLD
jgi:hypothetical protein